MSLDSDPELMIRMLIVGYFRLAEPRDHYRRSQSGKRQAVTPTHGSPSALLSARTTRESAIRKSAPLISNLLGSSGRHGSRLMPSWKRMTNIRELVEKVTITPTAPYGPVDLTIHGRLGDPASSLEVLRSSAPSLRGRWLRAASFSGASPSKLDPAVQRENRNLRNSCFLKNDLCIQVSVLLDLTRGLVGWTSDRSANG
jgi:hypothetical protein